jgi:hypothetical protein
MRMHAFRVNTLAQTREGKLKKKRKKKRKREVHSLAGTLKFGYLKK